MHLIWSTCSALMVRVLTGDVLPVSGARLGHIVRCRDAMSTLLVQGTCIVDVAVCCGSVTVQWFCTGAVIIAHGCDKQAALSTWCALQRCSSSHCREVQPGCWWLPHVFMYL
jgi:hypothetical protein